MNHHTSVLDTKITEREPAMATVQTQSRGMTRGMQAAYPSGQRLRCDQCGSEIEIVKACQCHPPDQVLQCCGKDMIPAG